MRRFKLVSLCVAFVLLLALLGAPSSAIAAPKKGSGGWYWPVGTENFQGWSGYWKQRGHSWHMAQDMPASVGHAVYAVGDGVIAESKAGAGYGGVLVVWHVTGDGTKFLAVYGHITRAKGTKKGAKVKAGQVIGKVNGSGHVHFGVHPGDAYPPDRNPYRGHTYDSKNTYGWVDPVKFLRTHPAYLPYTAPELPAVTTVSTPSTPTVLGVADGRVWWRLASEDESDTPESAPLPGATAPSSAEEDAPVTFDTTGFVATTSGTGFTLFNRQPRISAKFSARTTPWKRPIVVTGSLTNAAGKPFTGATVSVERKSGSRWIAMARGITGLEGAYSIGVVPARAYTVRVRFVPPKTYAATSTPAVVITPQPGLHAPDKFTQAKGKAEVTISGKLDARHTKGRGNVRLEVQQLVNGAWVTVRSLGTRNANAASASSRYSAKMTLAAGAWRVRASCNADSRHAAQQTGWVGFSVK